MALQLKSTFLILLAHFALQAQIAQKSFYFTPEKCLMTEYSANKYQEWLKELGKYYSQIIEINAFSESSLKGEYFAQCYLDSILKYLPEQKGQPSINVFGSERTVLNFKPVNWNRVDIYYYLGDEITNTVQINYTGNSVENDTVSIVEMEERITAANPPSIEPIQEGVPLITPINFIGGKAKVTKDSYFYMEYLKDVLQRDSSLSAHIRGHVCCGKNFRISHLRAKVVYKYLVKHGIAKERLSFKGYSNTEPIVWPERTMEDREANRRVDIIFERLKDDIILVEH